MGDRGGGGIVLAILLLASPLSPWPPLVEAAGPGPGRLLFTHVAPTQKGGALIWPLFTTENASTLIAITNTSVRIAGTDEVAGACEGAGCLSGPSVNLPGLFTLVRFHVRRDTDSADLLDFSVCLSPGDVWTAAIFREGTATRVVSSDSSGINCDTGSCATGLSAVLFGGAQRGYIEAVAIDAGPTQQIGCDGAPGGKPDCPTCAPNPFVNALFGESLFVSLGSGLANGANATAIGSFQRIAPGLGVVDTIRSGITPSAGVNGARKRVFFALTHPGKNTTVGSLQSRWVLDSSVGFDTQLVVTFPLGNIALQPFADFGFGTADVGATFDFSIPSTMALFLRDDGELSSSSPRQVTIGREVNVITLSAEVADNPSLLPGATAKGGWLHLLIDRDENEFPDAVAAMVDDSGTPTNEFVPAMLPVVGFSILTASTPNGGLSALLPWRYSDPPTTYSCVLSGGGDNSQCTGVGIFP